jgi:lipid A 3-O-deacylase
MIRASKLRRCSPAQLRRALLTACAALLSAPVDHVAAQVASARRFGVENDFFDFRPPPIRRPDYDYTHGTKVAVGTDGAWGWGRLAGSLPACRFEDPSIDAVGPCASTIVEIGQLIFTPQRDSRRPVPGQRPYAGWLYGTLAARAESPRRLRTMTFTAGVTGPASLGGATHAGFHRLKPRARLPLGWSHQMPNEPAGAVGYSDRRLALELRRPGVGAGLGRVADLVADWGIQLGTVRTSATVGTRARFGWNVSHPWREAPSGRAPWELYALSGIRGEWVRHDLFLDGSTFGQSARVERIPLLGQLEVGAGLRAWRLALEYRLVTVGQEYRTGPQSHPYGVISASWLRPARAGSMLAGRNRAPATAHGASEPTVRAAGQ